MQSSASIAAQAVRETIIQLCDEDRAAHCVRFGINVFLILLRIGLDFVYLGSVHLVVIYAEVQEISFSNFVTNGSSKTI